MRNAFTVRLVSFLTFFLAVEVAFGADTLGPGTITEWGRALERLIIVVAAGLSMFYGYRLFTITAKDEGSLMAKAGNWQLKLAKVGPGVFFALFGAAIVIYALFKAPTIEADASGVKIQGALPSMDEVTGDQRLRVLRALNSIRKVSEGGNPTVSVPDRAQLASASNALEPVQAILIDSIVGKGSYNEWRHLTDLQQYPDDSYAKAMKDQSVRMRYEAVNQLMMETNLQQDR